MVEGLRVKSDPPPPSPSSTPTKTEEGWLIRLSSPTIGASIFPMSREYDKSSALSREKGR